MRLTLKTNHLPTLVGGGILRGEKSVGGITEDVVEGLSCSGCGIYFVVAHGYPVLCEDCWKDIPEVEKSSGITNEGLQKTIEAEL
jgi:hypothetical protein